MIPAWCSNVERLCPTMYDVSWVRRRDASSQFCFPSRPRDGNSAPGAELSRASLVVVEAAVAANDGSAGAVRILREVLLGEAAGAGGVTGTGASFDLAREGVDR